MAKERIEEAMNLFRKKRFNFNVISPEATDFLEWLVIKFRAFKYKEFYYSFRRIEDEIGHKRRKLLNIIQSFEEVGFLSHETRGMPKCSYFNLDIENLIEFINRGGIIKKNTFL